MDEFLSGRELSVFFQAPKHNWECRDVSYGTLGFASEVASRAKRSSVNLYAALTTLLSPSRWESGGGGGGCRTELVSSHGAAAGQL